MSTSHGDSATRAAGLLALMHKSFIALLMAADVLELLETLNTCLQSKQKTMNGMKVAVEMVLKSIEVKRNDINHFTALYKQSVEIQKEYDLEEIKSPRNCKPPNGYTGSAESFHPGRSSTEYFKLEYFKLADTASSRLRDIVRQESIAGYEALESCLLSGSINETCSQYAELKRFASCTAGDVSTSVQVLHRHRRTGQFVLGGLSHQRPKKLLC